MLDVNPESASSLGHLAVGRNLVTLTEGTNRDGNPVLRLADPDRFSWRHWDGELLFFDDLSGETRLLGGCAGIVLELIAERQPIELETLEATLAAMAETQIDDVLRHQVRQAAETLYRYGLIDDTGP